MVSSKSNKTYRLHVSGITPEITEADLLSRLNTFGKVSKVYGLQDRDANGQVKKYAFLTMSSSKHDLNKCLSLFKNVQWKGTTLSISRASKDAFPIAFEKERRHAKVVEEQEKANERKRKRNQLRQEVDGYQAKDIEKPVTDGRIDERPMWKRGKYGRAIRLMRLTKDDGTRMVYDPSMHKDDLQKLYGKVELGSFPDSTPSKKGKKAKPFQTLDSSPAKSEGTEKRPAMADVSEISTLEELQESIKEEKKRNAGILAAMFGDDTSNSIQTNSLKGIVPPGDDTSNSIQTNSLKGIVPPGDDTSNSIQTNNLKSIFTPGDDISNSIQTNNLKSIFTPGDDVSNSIPTNSLKSLFTPGVESARFALFGGEDDEQEKTEIENQKPSIPEHMRLEPVEANASSAVTRSLGQVDQRRLKGFEAQLPLFFFHLHDPDLLGRSRYNAERVVERKLTESEIVEDWKERRLELTRDFKAKAKEARKLSRRKENRHRRYT